MRAGILTLATCCLALVAVLGFSASGRDRAGRPTHSHPAPSAVLTPGAAIALSSGWQYVADHGDVGLRDDWAHSPAGLAWRRVSVPNDFNPVVSNSSYRGSVGWYKLRFTGPAATAGRSWEVHFGEVRRTAEVWLNGTQIGTNSDPYAPFSLPASTLRSGSPNVLIVRVDSRKGPGSFPEDWWNWGGIVQPVSLEPVGRIALRGLGVISELSCDYRCADLLIEGTLENRSQQRLAPEIAVRTTSPSGVVSTSRTRVHPIAAGATASFRFRVPIQGPPDLWAPGNPALYRVQIATSAQHRVEQLDSLRVGARSVRVVHGLLYLNGQRLWLHGASIHEDIAGRGAALTTGDIDTIVSELRSAGANITRAHYLLSQALLDALDAAGIMVWSQPPVDHADARLRTASGRARALAMLRATILADRSHASVVIHSVGNELSPTPDSTPGTRSYIQQAVPVARRLDSPAPVALDIYCYPGFPAQNLYRNVDLLGISDYFGWYTGRPGHLITQFEQLMPFLTEQHARYPAQAIVIGEFGAEALFEGPVTTKGSFAFQADYLQRTFGVLDQLPFMSGAIYWTLREFAVNPGWTGGAALPVGDPPSGLHHKGLIAYDGTEKPAFAVAQKLFAQTPSYVQGPVSP